MVKSAGCLLSKAIVSNQCLSHVPSPPKPLEQMSEHEFTTWLGSLDLEEFAKLPKEFSISEPPISKVFSLRTRVRQTETLILPLSLEDNSSLPGE